MTSSMSFISQNHFNRFLKKYLSAQKCNPTLSRCHLWVRTIFICRLWTFTGSNWDHLIQDWSSVVSKELSTHRPGPVNYLDFLSKILIRSGNFLSGPGIYQRNFRISSWYFYSGLFIVVYKSLVIDKIPWSIFHTSSNVSISSQRTQH